MSRSNKRIVERAKRDDNETKRIELRLNETNLNESKAILNENEYSDNSNAFCMAVFPLQDSALMWQRRPKYQTLAA